MSRSHASGPFSAQANLRVQYVMQLQVGQSQQVTVSADPVQGLPSGPVLLRFVPNVDTATSGGTDVVLVGTPSVPNQFYASGDITPGTPGIGTEKKFVITQDTIVVASLTSTAIAASLALTITSNTGADTQTVTINGQTYTFNTSLTNTANNVLIGADNTTMAANLAAAINAGAGAGTTYGTGTVANAAVTASATAGVVTVTAKTAGSVGNSVTVAETLTNGSWAGGATSLAGGSDPSTAGQVTIFIDA